MIRKIALVTAFLATAAFAPPAQAGTLGTDVIGMFPKEIGEFAYADLRLARQQPWFPQLKRQLLPARFRQFEQLLTAAGIDPNVQVEEIAWALVPTVASGANAVPTSEQVIGIALGAFRPEVAEAYFIAQKLPTVKVRTYSLYAFGNASGPGDLFFLFIDSNTAAFGQRRELEKLIAVRHGEGEGLLGNTELSPLILKANGSAAVWAVMNAAYARLALRQLAPDAAQFPQAQQLTSKLRALTMQFVVRTDLQAIFQAVCATPDDANTFAALMQAGLMYRRFQVGSTNPELAALLDRTTIEPSGDRLDLRMTLTEAQVSALIARNTFSLSK
jgi:hypothetical protein